jgi:hypothetical protein
MTHTYGDMQTRIADELHRADLATNNRLTNAIQSAIKHYDRERWWFTETTTSASLTTSAGQATYTLPSDFKRLDALTLTINGWKRDIDPMPYGQMDAQDAGNAATRGPSRWWAIYGEVLRLYPIPDGIYVQTMSYQKRLATLSATTDTNAWVDEMEPLIRTKAKEILARHVQRSKELADGLLAEIKIDIYPNARAENDERVMSGRLTPHGT